MGKVLASEKDLYILAVVSGKVCPYCKAETVYVDSSEVYNGTSYGMIYLCRPCDAWVGVHKGTDKALGRVADADLRKWKIKAHDAFDRLWHERRLRRKSAYRKLSFYLGIPENFCHIGFFSVETCKKVVEWANKQIKRYDQV